MPATECCKPISVFLVRHGERADELLKLKGIQVPREDKLDPFLSSRGYEQARDSLSILIECMNKEGTARKIGVFCSPMRRTCGSALMLSATDITSYPALEWGFRGSVDDNTIPVIVLNGLSTCATQVKKQGPINKLVQEGKIPCADCPANDGSLQGPMVMAARSMLRHQPVYDCSYLPYGWVQFCSIEAKTGIVAPMAPRMSTAKIDATMIPVVNATAENLILQDLPTEQDSWRDSLNLGIQWADVEGCNTVIFLAHREAILGLLDICGQSMESSLVSTPHCCIGSFVAISTGEGKVRWQAHSVVDYNSFDVGMIPGAVE
jgi:hypothetical protein|uniref:Phosphoglycerate mutase family protein n=1 Tax=Phaeodactylum tricornutum TaxID=2850 RepID=A0A8J9TKR0_PHATR